MPIWHFSGFIFGKMFYQVYSLSTRTACTKYLVFSAPLVQVLRVSILLFSSKLTFRVCFARESGFCVYLKYLRLTFFFEKSKEFKICLSS